MSTTAPGTKSLEAGNSYTRRFNRPPAGHDQLHTGLGMPLANCNSPGLLSVQSLIEVFQRRAPPFVHTTFQTYMGRSRASYDAQEGTEAAEHDNTPSGSRRSPLSPQSREAESPVSNPSASVELVRPPAETPAVRGQRRHPAPGNDDPASWLDRDARVSDGEEEALIGSQEEGERRGVQTR